MKAATKWTQCCKPLKKQTKTLQFLACSLRSYLVSHHVSLFMIPHEYAENKLRQQLGPSYLHSKKAELRATLLLSIATLQPTAHVTYFPHPYPKLSVLQPTPFSTRPVFRPSSGMTSKYCCSRITCT